MKLAFSGQGRYPDLTEGYALYRKRSRKENALDEKMYNAVVKRYCKRLAERLVEEGIVELPNGMGTIAAATLTRKPQYRNGKFIGYGKRDYASGNLDGTLKTFGMVFLPRHTKNQNLRCLGYVANRKLFQTMKERYMSGEADWLPMVFNEDMI